MAKVKVRPTHREELPGIAMLRSAAQAEAGKGGGRGDVLDLDMGPGLELEHLVTNDPDGFFTALDKTDTIGYAAVHVRLHQWVLSEIYVQPEHRGRGAGDALLGRALAHGERSGAREYMTVVRPDPGLESLLLRHGLRPIVPVYELSLDRESAHQLAGALSRLLAGQDVSGELLGRRGQADLDRLDRVTRNITRAADHVFWLKARGLNAAFIRQGARIAAYAYGGRHQTGPMAASTQEAALAAVGWALQLSLNQSRTGRIHLRVPATFAGGLEALLDGGARLQQTLLVYGRNLTVSLDRTLLGPPALP